MKTMKGKTKDSIEQWSRVPIYPQHQQQEDVEILFLATI